MGDRLIDDLSIHYGLDVINKCDTNGGMWPWAMCPHTSRKRWKAFVESSRTKQFHKSSYIIFEGPIDERRGERVKVEINVFYLK